MCLRCLLSFFPFLLFVENAVAQFSISTDASLLRNLNRRQKFWAFGQTVHLNFPLSEKDAVYAWISYYTPGKFKNNFVAVAKDPLFSPQQVSYTAYSALRYRQLSIGWKHYFTGAYNEELDWSIYGLAGFGMLIGKATNTYDRPVDTASYQVQSPAEGSGNFKRLTFDVGLGVDFPVSTGVFLYTELRTWIPTTRYPSTYLYKDNYHIPALAIVNLGIRLLIE